ncbi:multidrug efflux MFS transporter [Bacillus mojavensis]|uniref:multidrug efflux MFS transporter n=1 Tax=Bacillus mojavensis TaxID=72360 RepID=UPI002DBAA3E3|nr:multidrug efflux MFS transporter [Bacillus mojavensis]MEC1680634.1 multidrug efflux MFS transporter [Bacillus mojavensis]MEC1713201.1 multidrug efflux MFS transporter [Bacillus mojavensis]MEC1751084.1 multidrug efflux MFS transporter [Bacillus mojavensis]
MWLANFFVSASTTMIIPFLSLYIETLSTFSNGFVQRWSGYVFGITFLMAFLVSPFWGRFGDKRGYKKILLTTGIGIAVSILLMGFVTSVYQLFFLRMAMGLVTGFIPTSLAMISAQTPKSSAGKTLGTLQMGQVSGSLFGPLLGGVLADHFGFTYTFFITSFVIFLAVLLVLFGVKEQPLTEKMNKRQSYTRKEVLSYIFHHPALWVMMLLTMLIQTGNFSIQPLLALYVNELHGPANLAFFSGMAFSATGLGSLLLARKWGDLGDRYGHRRILIGLLIAASLFFIPQALASSFSVLLVFRFLFGMAMGGLLPCITAAIRVQAPGSIQGEVLGYNVSFRFLGNVLGPLLGGIISSHFNISAAFYVTAFLFFAGACLLWIMKKFQKESYAKAS